MNNNNKNNSSGGIGFIGLLTVVLIALKLAHVIEWSWIRVFSPIWIYCILMFVILFAVVLIRRK